MKGSFRFVASSIAHSEDQCHQTSFAYFFLVCFEKNCARIKNIKSRNFAAELKFL